MGITAADTVLENHRFRLEIDPHSGFIRSLRDKQEDTQVFAGEAARPVVIDDPSDTWGHNVLRFDREVGCFDPASIRCTESGPVRAAIRVESRWGASSLVQEFILHADLDRIDVRVTVDWRETQKMLKLRFPVNVNMMKATHEIPYGTIVRSTNGDEEPGQTWIDLSGVSRDTGKLYGMSLLNDGKYSFNVTLRDIGLTVLRSPIYAHHIPEEPVSGESYSYMDQGIQHFQYTLLPHAGSLVQAGTVRRAAELNQPPVALFGTFHPGGTLPQAASFLSIDRENVVVSVVKQAEDGNGWIVRAYETAGQAVEAEIDLPAWKRQIHARFGPSEIKTFLIPQDPERPVVETNLLEWID